MTVQTETITCLTVSGPRLDILVAGCHSGNLVSINTKQRSKKETYQLAHSNLIRVLASLSTLRNKFFVSADVCGFIKVWAAQMRPTKVNEFQLDGAISYNSMVEVEGFLPKKPEFKESAIIAVALKS